MLGFESEMRKKIFSRDNGSVISDVWGAIEEFFGLFDFADRWGDQKL